MFIFEGPCALQTTVGSLIQQPTEGFVTTTEPLTISNQMSDLSWQPIQAKPRETSPPVPLRVHPRRSRAPPNPTAKPSSRAKPQPATHPRAAGASARRLTATARQSRARKSRPPRTSRTHRRQPRAAHRSASRCAPPPIPRRLHGANERSTLYPLVGRPTLANGGHTYGNE